MSNVRRTLAIKVQTPGGDNPLQMQLVGKGPFYRGIPVTGLALVGIGGTAPYAFSILAGGDSNGGINGLTLNTDGTFSGSGDESGRFVFVAEVADSADAVFAHSFSITFLAQLFVVAGTPTPGEEGMFYSYQFKVEDATGTVLTSGYTITAGNVPDGTGLNGAGRLSGTMTSLAMGISYFTVTATNGVDSIDIPVSLIVYSEMQTDPDTSPYNLPNAFVGVPYDHRIVGFGGLPPYRFSIATDQLTAVGLRLQPSGHVKGVPTSSGLTTSSFNATDALGSTNVSGRTLHLLVVDPNGRIQPQRNTVDVGDPGFTKLDLVEGSGVSITATNDGETAQFEISAIPGNGGIGTINGVGPDSSGGLLIDGIGIDSNGDLFVESTGGQSSIQFKDEGLNLGTSGTVSSINWVGPGVIATRVGNAITVTIAGGSGSGIQTVEGVGPDSSGNLDLASADGSVAISAGAGVDFSSRLIARLATAAALPANTYSNGTAGVGATITITATGVLTIDGSSVALNDDVLVKDESAGLRHGLYRCTTAGAVGVSAVLTRSARMDSSAKYGGATIAVMAGTVNVGALFVCSTVAPTVGTTTIVFSVPLPASGVAAGTYGDATHVAQTTIDDDGRVIAASNVAIAGFLPNVSATSLLGGSGEDGNATFDGTNTFAFASKSGNNYTLLRNVALATMKIATGCTLNPATAHISWQVWDCRTGFYGTLLATGGIGGSPSGANTGTAGTNGVPTPIGVPYFASGGVTGSSSGTAGVTTGNSANSANVGAGTGTTGGGSAQGGRGGAGTTGTPGTAGSIGAWQTTNTNAQPPIVSVFYVLRTESGANTLIAGQAGQGGTGGCGDGTRSGGGGGGGGGPGGGIHLLVGTVITDGGTPAGMFQCKGGNGGNGSNSGNGLGNVGGGGGGSGGGGGAIYCYYGALVGPSVAGFFDVSGGTGGNGGTGVGTGLPGNGGGGGNAGKIYLFNMSTGTWTLSTFYNAGGAASGATGGAGGSGTATLS